jgi:hypothetical protein
MQDPLSPADIQQLRNQLKEEQDKYVLAITGDNNLELTEQIRERINILQKRLTDITSAQ